MRRWRKTLEICVPEKPEIDPVLKRYLDNIDKLSDEFLKRS